jgi:hypothetical protein
LEHKDSIKDDYIETLINNVHLEIDELKTTELSPVFFIDYKLYKFNVGTNKIHVKNNISIKINFGQCTEYIIAYNDVLQKYYRLKGFSSSDFNTLMSDIILHYDNKLTSKEVVKNLEFLNYEELDFKCLLKYSKDSPKNRWKYPCMTICKDGGPSHISIER